MNQLIHPIVLVSCLILSGPASAWANGKGETGNAGFGRVATDPARTQGGTAGPGAGVEEGKTDATDRFGSDRTDSRTDRKDDRLLSKPARVVEGTIGTWERKFAGFGWTLADWDSQRMETVRRIARSSPADSALIRRFITGYGQANDYEGRRRAIIALLDALSPLAVEGEDFNKETFSRHLEELNKTASRETLGIFMNGSRLLDIEALLHESRQILAEAECSDQSLEDPASGRYALGSSRPEDHCYETVER